MPPRSAGETKVYGKKFWSPITNQTELLLSVKTLVKQAGFCFDTNDHGQPRIREVMLHECFVIMIYLTDGVLSTFTMKGKTYIQLSTWNQKKYDNFCRLVDE